MSNLASINNDKLLFGGMSQSTGLSGNHTWSKPNTQAGGFSNAWGNFKDGVANFFQNTDWNDVATKGTALLSGVTGLIGNFQQTADIDDDSRMQQALSNYDAIGRKNYYDFSQVLSAYNNIANNAFVSKPEDYALSQGEKFGAIGSGITTGAGAGAAFGPWGALAGGVIGGLSSLGSVLVRDENAKAMALTNNIQNTLAQNRLKLNLLSATDAIQDTNNAYGVARSVARGGKIERQQMSINEFANKVLGTKPAPRVVRQKCNGGVMVKIKG